MAISKSVLIVSSNAIAIQQLEPLLKKLGFDQVFTSGHAADALELAYAEQPDVALVNSQFEGRLDTKGLVKAMDKASVPMILLSEEHIKNQQYNYVSLNNLSELSLQEALEQAINPAKNRANKQANTFFIRTNNRFYRVKTADIRWIESDGNYSVIQCIEKKFILKMSLRRVLEELASYDFVQVHKRYIINASGIEYVDVSENKVYLSNKEIPIGRRYKDELLGRLKCLK